VTKVEFGTVCVAVGALVWMTGLEACSVREVQIREAEARNKRWGIAAPRIVRDVVYAGYGDRQLKLDLYLPPAPAQRMPGLIVVRGGAFRRGDKIFFSYIAAQLAAEGFAAASIEYRTSDEATFPAAVHDVKAAVRWMRANALEYGIDPDAIGAIGGSAGAYLVAMLGTSNGVPELEGSGGHPETSSDVQAVVAMGGAYDLQPKHGAGPQVVEAVTEFLGAPPDAGGDLVRAASPITYVTSRAAPLLLMHSPTDPDAPFPYAVEMAERYRTAGAFAALKEIDAPGLHGFWGSPLYWPETKKLAANFLRSELKAQ
jgi:pectinesterase